MAYEEGVDPVPVATPPKPWWASRTLWLNVTAAVLIALDGALGPLVKDHTTTFYIAVSLALAAANAALRVITTQPIGGSS